MVGGGELVVGYSTSGVGRMVASIVRGCQTRAQKVLLIKILCSTPDQTMLSIISFARLKYYAQLPTNKIAKKLCTMLSIISVACSSLMLNSRPQEKWCTLK